MLSVIGWPLVNPKLLSTTNLGYPVIKSNVVTRELI